MCLQLRLCHLAFYVAVSHARATIHPYNHLVLKCVPVDPESKVHVLDQLQRGVLVGDVDWVSVRY